MDKHDYESLTTLPGREDVGVCSQEAESSHRDFSGIYAHWRVRVTVRQEGV